MNKIINIMVLTSIVLFTNAGKAQTNYDLLEKHEKEIVQKNKIARITEYRIGLDKSGQSTWKRIDLIRCFNNKGLLTMEISPKYTTKIPDRGNQGLSLEELANIKLFDTNTPSGVIDTIFYSYDSRNNLKSKKERDHITSFKYDSNNNCIETCWRSDYAETTCNFSSYRYNFQNQIVTRIDSFGARSNTRDIRNIQPNITSNYKYDNKGRIIFDGKFNRVFNDKNQLIDVYVANGSQYRVQMFYNGAGQLSKQTENEGYIRSTYFFYNDEGLLIEKKVLNENNKLMELKKYEYAFL